MTETYRKLRFVSVLTMLAIACSIFAVGSAHADDESLVAVKGSLTVQGRGVHLEPTGVAGLTPSRPLIFEQGPVTIELTMVDSFRYNEYSFRIHKGDAYGEVVRAFGGSIYEDESRDITIPDNFSDLEPGDYVIESNCNFWSMSAWHESSNNPTYAYMTVVEAQPGGGGSGSYDDVEPMYRLYNPYSYEHFYTASKSERDGLVAEKWRYEATGWLAPKSGNPVYRLYNPNAGDHHFTLSEDERDSLVAAGWIDEGIGWYSDPAQTTPLYREYNPNMLKCNHNYTTSKAEHDSLVEAGWTDEGIGWYGA